MKRENKIDAIERPIATHTAVSALEESSSAMM
jgi:hypothetical protein